MNNLRGSQKKMLTAHKARLERVGTMANKFFFQSMARWCVAYARKMEWLPDVSTLLCVDCGKAAKCWEHRDYTRPLDVDPVCRECNAARGPAKTRKRWKPAQQDAAV